MAHDTNRSEQASATTGDRKTALASAAGTFVEWFDFMLFAFLSPTIAPLFFPADDPFASILSTYIVFALGFLVRPLGGALIGRWGDLYGRRKTLIVSVALMTVPMFLTAALPTHATLGIAAPILLALCRLAMGFSVGGEWGGTLVALFETAGHKRQATNIGMGFLTSGLGMIMASLLVGLCTHYLSPEQMADWGWRLLYLIGGLLTLTTLLLRRVMRETPSFEQLRRAQRLSARPLQESVRREWRQIVRLALLTGCGASTFYVTGVFIPGQVQAVAGWSADSVMILTNMILVIGAFAPWGFGWLADRWSARSLLLCSLVAMSALIGPLFYCIATRSGAGIWVLTFLFMIANSAFAPTSMSLCAGSFPTERRFTGLALGTNIGVLVLGSTAPAICVALTRAWGIYAPMVYLLAILLGTMTIGSSSSGSSEHDPERAT